VEPIRSQFSRPHGVLGVLAGALMARQNLALNRWAIARLDVRPGHRVLEIGFGPGVAVQRLAELVGAGRVCGIDPSATMLRMARRRNAAAILAGRVELRLGALPDLPYPPRAFDRILAVNSVQLWMDEPSLAALRRVLAPGGLMAVALQPRDELARWGAEAVGREIMARLAAAGFTPVRLDVRRIGRAECLCALVGVRS
jgi:ubiquinone/menaquinone biosynthesis C-methylase UbiE